MGTRSLTVFKENGKEFCVMYAQYDGYPDGLGLDLAKFLKDISLVNGISINEKRKIANGLGCLAAQVIAHLKDGPGGIYVYPPKARDCGEEYIYTIEEKEGKINLICFDVYYKKVLFCGSPVDFIKKFDPAVKDNIPENLTGFNSRWIDSFTYKNKTLTMKTNTGKFYNYNISPVEWNSLKDAVYSGQSVGAYFNKYIKK